MAHWNPTQIDYSTEVSDHWRDRRSKPWLLQMVSLLTALLFYAVVVGAVLFNSVVGGEPP
jgi:hypothetical protein